MQEKRNYKRYKLDVMSMHGEIPFASNVRILNISLSGVLLETGTRPDMGNRYMLRLKSEGKTLNLRGIVVRSALNKTNKDAKGNIMLTYTAGMHFTHLSNKKIIEIAKFIKKHLICEDIESGIYGAGMTFIDMSSKDKGTFSSIKRRDTVQVI
jgi:hypothetical protein